MHLLKFIMQNQILRILKPLHFFIMTTTISSKLQACVQMQRNNFYFYFLVKQLPSPQSICVQVSKVTLTHIDQPIKIFFITFLWKCFTITSHRIPIRLNKYKIILVFPKVPATPTTYVYVHFNVEVCKDIPVVTTKYFSFPLSCQQKRIQS